MQSTRFAFFRASFAAISALASLTLAGPARAEDPSPAPTPTARAQAAAPVPSHPKLSPYEEESVRLALEELGAPKDGSTIDHDPEGKTIEAIDIVRFDVLEDRDVVIHVTKGDTLEKVLTTGKKIANALHVTSKDLMVRREMLVSPGQPYNTALVEESIRNLRALPQIADAVFVAVKGQTPDRVRVVVVTKDLWSLRLSYNIALTAGGLQDLEIVPQETNLLGIHHTVSTSFRLQPLSYSFGVGYGIHRFGTSHVGATASLGIIFNRLAGSPEGSTGAITVGQPLYSSQTEWAWNASAGWTVGVARRYVNAQLGTYDVVVGPNIDHIPFEYKSAQATAGASLTRSFGWRNKNDFSAGFAVSEVNYSTFDLSAFDPRAASQFISTVLPVGENRVGPVVEWHSYTSNFHSILDFQTLGLLEDYRLGHEFYVHIYPVAKALGSTRDLLGAYLGAQYTVPMGDGFTRASVEVIQEHQLSPTDEISDASVTGVLRIVTPRFGIGRIVLDGSATNRYRNYLNTLSFLGGDTRLRGYPSQYYFGKDFMVYNVEYRTRPVRILSLELGLAAFYDVGNAFTGFDHIDPKQSVGGGIRLLIPWLNRVVFRVDGGFPLSRAQSDCSPPGTPCRIDPFNFFVTFDQAFGTGSIAP